MSVSHSYVPKHEIATDSELEELLAKFQITVDELPLMKSDDVMAKALGAKPGQVVKITRKLKKSGAEDVFLRNIVE